MGISVFSYGRMVKKDGAVLPEYHVNDYLCSVRVVTDADGEVLERNDYSGYGKRLTSSTGSANRYRFSGKEEQAFAGLAWQDFGARMYDPDLARWTTPDPLAEKYPGISPYVYCNDNPVNFVDPDGRAWGKVGKVAKKVYKTVKAGNKVSVKGILKSEWLDIVDNAHTIIDSDASLFEKGVAVFDLATGFGDEVMWFAKAVGVSDAIVDGAKASERSVSNTLIETPIDILPENQISRELLDKPNKRGNAFVFKEDGTAVEIRHAGQSADGPYIEMHRSDHRGKGNYKENHPNAGSGTQIDRKEFNKQRRYYWQKEYDKYYK